MIRRFLVTGLAFLVVALGVRASMASGMMPAGQPDGSLSHSAGAVHQAEPCAPDDGACCDVESCAVHCVSSMAPYLAGQLREAWQFDRVMNPAVPDLQRPDHVSPPPAPPPRASALS